MKTQREHERPALTHPLTRCRRRRRRMRYIFHL